MIRLRPPRLRRPLVGILGAALCLVPLLVLGCGGGEKDSENGAANAGFEVSDPMPVSQSWEREIKGYRRRVDAHCATEDGPLTEQQRLGFTGLSYYPPDPAFHFVVTPDFREAGLPTSFFDTKGNARYYTVHSRVHLRVSGKPVTLTLYRSQSSDYLFLPFQDATTGKETYEVGRYLELSPRDDGTIQVDFNLAKNPYCAYSDRWACPTVPANNRLEVAVTAGEKGFVH